MKMTQQELVKPEFVIFRYDNKLEELNLNYIDLVIYYKEGYKGVLDVTEIEQIRNKFFLLIQREGFKMNYFNTHNNNKYVLLTCPLDRLMDEAEKMELELPLKIVINFMRIKISFELFFYLE